MGRRNESRTRRPSVKTIEPRYGHVNRRCAGSVRAARYFRDVVPRLGFASPGLRSCTRRASAEASSTKNKERLEPLLSFASALTGS
jgi:hypothetical protein